MSKIPNEITSFSSRMLRAWMTRSRLGGFSPPLSSGSHALRNCSHEPGLSRRAENITIMGCSLRLDGRRRDPLTARTPKLGSAPMAEKRWIVPLPKGAERPYRVFVNGVPQTEGRDYTVERGALVF